jgi:hypothetical protein
MIEKKLLFLGLSGLFMLSACGGDIQTNYPKDSEDRRKEARGKLTGEGLSLFGSADDKQQGDGSSGIGVNAYLWRATLDSLGFMPLASADPFGGVIITDWYEDPNQPNERYKINALILDKELRSDAIKISVFRQKKNASNAWSDVAAESTLPRDLENAILTRARELKVQNNKK